ncbi:MAG TPA: type 1 glutamine amidotransferase domain-containing protein [Terriglobales bacterium]|nr:type 1 glutamine amidotransferase domain-containing protein [Terriglobales bacterium]
MAQENLEGMRIAIIATQDFEESELIEPQKALEAAGAKTVVISTKAGKIQAVRHDEKTIQVDVNATFDEARASQFDAVQIPGGALNADTLRVVPEAQEFVREMDRSGKPIAVICHGPWLLVSAGLVRGRKMTSYHTIQDDLRNAGAEWQDAECVRDRNWVSSRQPSDLPAFNREMIRLFAEQRGREKRVA